MLKASAFKHTKSSKGDPLFYQSMPQLKSCCNAEGEAQPEELHLAQSSTCTQRKYNCQLCQEVKGNLTKSPAEGMLAGKESLWCLTGFFCWKKNKGMARAVPDSTVAVPRHWLGGLAAACGCGLEMVKETGMRVSAALLWFIGWLS